MGGQYEDTIGSSKKSDGGDGGGGLGGLLQPANQKARTGSLPVVGDLSQAIRFHQSGGEIHFHVDDAPDGKLKVALPVAEWWSAWEQVKNLRTERYRYVDHKNGCMLEVECGLDAQGKFEVKPTLSRIASGTGSTFDKLEDFTYNVQKKKK